MTVEFHAGKVMKPNCRHVTSASHMASNLTSVKCSMNS